MSAVLLNPPPHICAAQSVIATGNKTAIAAVLHCSTDTVERMGREYRLSQWTHHRIEALIRFEERALGTMTIAEAMPGRVLVGHAENVDRDLSENIGMNATLIAEENQVLAAGHSNIRDRLTKLAALKADVDRDAAKLLQTSADIGAEMAELRKRMGGAP